MLYYISPRAILYITTCYIIYHHVLYYISPRAILYITTSYIIYHHVLYYVSPRAILYITTSYIIHHQSPRTILYITCYIIYHHVLYYISPRVRTSYTSVVMLPVLLLLVVLVAHSSDACSCIKPTLQNTVSTAEKRE